MSRRRFTPWATTRADLRWEGRREVFVSAALPLLVPGSGIDFNDRGEHARKGLPGTWQLLAVNA
jgi:hypothetical protein